MKELAFDTTASKHILLLPGLLAPVQTLFPLVRYLRQNQHEYTVTALPLGLNVAGFESLVARAVKTITHNLLQKTQPHTIIIFGHSHGGRVACEVVRKLKKISPSTEFSVITAGSPMSQKLAHFSWFNDTLFRLSKAYRDWPPITQPDSTIVKKYMGYYSDKDKTITPDLATAEYTGELIKLTGLSHHDLISPTKIGPVLLELLKEF